MSDCPNCGAPSDGEPCEDCAPPNFALHQSIRQKDDRIRALEVDLIMARLAEAARVGRCANLEAEKAALEDRVKEETKRADGNYRVEEEQRERAYRAEQRAEKAEADLMMCPLNFTQCSRFKRAAGRESGERQLGRHSSGDASPVNAAAKPAARCNVWYNGSEREGRCALPLGHDEWHDGAAENQECGT